MPRAAVKPKREPVDGSVFLSDVVAENVRDWRKRRELSQDEVARRMRALGHDWVQRTASESERGVRSISIDELASLAIVLGATFVELLDFGDRAGGLDYGHPGGAMKRRAAQAWTRSGRRITLVDVDDDGEAHFRVERAALDLLADRALVPPAPKEGDR